MDIHALLHEFDHEMMMTRTVLARLPMGRADWKPHDRSLSLGELANHTAGIPTWMSKTLPVDQFELDGDYDPEAADTTEALVELFDDRVRAARAVLEATTPEELGRDWTLVHNGAATFTAPKAAVLRTFILSHNIHHRAQLGVYLRLLGLPVPATYGPSADEG